MHIYAIVLMAVLPVFFFTAVILEPCEGAEMYVNGKRVTEPTVLRSGLFFPHFEYFFKTLWVGSNYVGIFIYL